MPSTAVFEEFNDGIDRKRYMMWINSGEVESFRERWDLIDSALKRRPGGGLETSAREVEAATASSGKRSTNRK